MNIIFLSNTGTQHALIAAHLFLDRLQGPDFGCINGFCDTVRDESGLPIYIGIDNQDRKVYTLGVGKDVLMAKKSLEDLRHLLGSNEQELVIEPIYIKGQHLIMLLSHWPKLLGGARLNVLGSTYLLSRQFNVIQKAVDNLRDRLNNRR